MNLERLRPTPAEWVDLGFATALCAIGIIGFRTAFSGGEELSVGIPAVLAGVAVGAVLAKARVPLLVGAAGAVLALFAFAGPVALRSEALLGVLPAPGVFESLVDGIVQGPARLLTTLPPAGQAGNLLAIPYLTGFTGGLLSAVLALRAPRQPWAVLPALAVLAVAVLFGIDEPAALLLQGAVFAAVALAWMSLREHRAREVQTSTRSRARLARGAALLGVVVVSAGLIGPNLPLAGAKERFILRDQVEPPFDPRTYPSPLAGFRNFKNDDENDDDDVLFTVEGLPEGASVRWAVMDEYDGFVWRVTGSGTTASGRFDRVGDEIENPARGEEAEVEFEVGEHGSTVWIPTIGAAEHVRFHGPRAGELEESFRFNRATDAGASPSLLQPGDRYTVRAVLPAPPRQGDEDDLAVDADAAVGSGALDSVAAAPTFEAAAAKHGGAADLSPYEQAKALQTWFLDVGRYSDGGADAAPTSPSGHGLGRLASLLAQAEQTGQMVGNGEQYAAAMAVLAQERNLPARVVLGFRPAADGRVELTRGDVEAWVEVAFEDAGWVPFFPTPDESRQPEKITPPAASENKPEIQPPPNTIPPPPERPPEPVDPESGERDNEEGTTRSAAGRLLFGAVVVSIPILLALSPALLVLLAKSRRRRRRRNAAPARAVIGGWQEVVDTARDIGMPVPRRATRREVGRSLGGDAVGLARATDAAVFGADDPTNAHASRIWQQADAVRESMLAALRRRDRLRAALALTSLRGSR